MSTFDQVKEIIIDTLNFDAEDIQMESNFFEDLEADSLDVVELMMALEEKMGVKIPDEELQNLRTVGSVVEYIDAHK
ncbi:MAG TPA: acyl carrier protein [Lachnospiraceae bacterium]|nr:acyl carrier protein [Lachnospiraceae bacterium]